MKRIIILLCFFPIFASAARFSDYLCQDPSMNCIKITKWQSWEKLWPDDRERDLVMRLNRLNIPLRQGMVIAVPKNLSRLSPNDLAPYEHKINATGNQTIIVSPALLAWAAYDRKGELIKWGPLSAGKDYCPDTNSECRSKIGVYNIYRKKGPECFSSKYPIATNGGAPMPYCMFYTGGYALHGSNELPGFNTSHGCIRLLTEDARWLNEEFTVAANDTKVVVLPYENG